jgi:hypothetical protein
MGMKSAPQMPPPVDTSVIDETKKKEAALKAEKDKMLSVNKQGKYGTILTSGLGVEEEASTAKTMLGGTVV